VGPARSIVIFLLLLCVPFQAAVGATGLICPNGTGHSHSSIAFADQRTTAATHDHHGSDGLNDHDHAASDQTPGGDGPGKCSIRSECSFSAAPVPSSLPDFVAPDAVLKVSVDVDSAMHSRAGDSLFRPPRSIAL